MWDQIPEGKHSVMTNLKSAWTTVALVAALALIGAYFGMRAGAYKFELGLGTHALQETLDKTLELRAEPQDKVQISSIRIDLSDNRIVLNIDAATDYHVPNTDKEMPLNVHAQANGAVRYDKNGTFYLKPEQLTEKGFSIGDEPIIYQAKAISAESIQQAAEIYLKQRPLFSTHGLGPGWEQGRASLISVQVQDNMVFATLSMWQITDGLVVALATLLLCAAAAVALVFAGLRRF
jgi:hypothetical protein